jgi:hypothetical protein
MCGDAEFDTAAATNKGAKADVPKPPAQVHVPPDSLVPPPRELWNPPETSWTALVRDPKSPLREVPLSDISE